MNVKDLFPSRWIAPEDLGTRRIEVVIEKTAIEDLRNPMARKGEPKTEKRIVLWFYKAQKQMCLNKTQAFRIAELTGQQDTEKWIGHSIVLLAGYAPNNKPTIIIEPPAHKPQEEKPEEQKQEETKA